MLEIGSSLREARQRRGIDLSEASEATMIRARYLEALESERFDMLPEGPYLRSFLREYAEYLGLDGDILVSEWMLQFAPVRPPLPEPPRRRRFDRQLSDPAWRRGALVLLALAAAGIVVWQLGGSSPTTERSAPPVIPAAAAATPPTPRKPKVQPATTLAVRPPLVLAAARGPCWVLVRIGSASGTVVEERTLQQGQTVRFGLKQPLWIRLGAPWNVDVSIGRRSFNATLPGSPGNVLASERDVAPA